MPREKELPQRSTRGKRMNQALDDEEAEADTSFWNQDFFKEEAVDDDYNTESESEDVPDSDFDDEEEDDDEEDPDKDVRAEPKKKTMKPPGHKPKPKPKAAPKKAKPASDDEYEEDDEEGGEEGDEEDEDGEARPKAKKAPRPPPEPVIYVAPTLRRSTVARVAESEQDRQYKKKSTRKRTTSTTNSNWRPLTQSEMLAEAALNEIENTRSLKTLLAMEEETKRKAQIVKKKNAGASVRFRSRKGFEGEERTTLELVNTYVLPPWMPKFKGVPPAKKPACAITGLAAKYTDPPTRTPFANCLAFKRLRTGAGPLAPALQQQLVAEEEAERQARAARGRRDAAGMHQQQQDQQQQAWSAGGPGGSGQYPPVQPQQQQPSLAAQLAAQRQRREQLEQHAAALIQASKADPGLGYRQQGASPDLMALLMDVQRTVTARA